MLRQPGPLLLEPGGSTELSEHAAAWHAPCASNAELWAVGRQLAAQMRSEADVAFRRDAQDARVQRVHLAPALIEMHPVQWALLEGEDGRCASPAPAAISRIWHRSCVRATVPSSLTARLEMFLAARGSC